MATAQRTLCYLAIQLSEQHTTDLAWWHIPTWIPHRSRMIGGTLAGVLMNGLMGGLVLGLGGGIVLGLITGLGVGLGIGLRRGAPTIPTRIALPDYRYAFQKPRIGIMLYALVVVLAVGLVVGLASGLVFGLLVGLVAGLMGGAFVGLMRHMGADGSPLGPADIWRQDRNYTLGSWLVFALTTSLIGRVVPGLASELVLFVASGLVFVLLVGLVFVFLFERMFERKGAAQS